MSRYFIEVAYKGTSYSGFQVQENANTIQSEVERSLMIFYHKQFQLTGASRTDSGVHALQNYFHFESDIELNAYHLYNLNAILPSDIVIINIFKVADSAHCRFDAVSRTYEYFIYNRKDPFLKDIAYYYPYRLDINKLNEAANEILKVNDFTSFSKRNTQVNNFNCTVVLSDWRLSDNGMVYTVSANRFLRGMVRGLVGTMLRVGTGKQTMNNFIRIIKEKDCSKADFSVPAHGLFLKNVLYPYINQ